MRGLLVILFLVAFGNVAAAMPCHQSTPDENETLGAERPKAEMTQVQSDCDDCESGHSREGCCDGKGGKCARACCRLFAGAPFVTIVPQAGFGLLRNQPITVPVSRNATPPKRPPIAA